MTNTSILSILVFCILAITSSVVSYSPKNQHQTLRALQEVSEQGISPPDIDRLTEIFRQALKNAVM